MFTTPPFGLGQSYKGTDDAGNLINDEWLGRIYYFPANDPTSTAARGMVSQLATGRYIKAVILRNTLGAPLTRKRLAMFERTAGYSLLESVNGYAAVLAEKFCVFVDGYSDDTIADDDLFWGILEGPTIVLTPQSGDDFNGDIAVGAQLVAATGASTGHADQGRVANVTLPGQTGATQAFAMAANQVGIALSGRTTAETDSALLVHALIKH